LETIALLIIGVILGASEFADAAVTPFVSGRRPVVPKGLSVVFITIACGAISGFHVCFPQGTTPKMIAKKLMRG